MRPIEMVENALWTIGYRAIEEIARWDWVLANDENDPTGPLKPKRVEEVFKRTGEVARARARGKDILSQPRLRGSGSSSTGPSATAAHCPPRPASF